MIKKGYLEAIQCKLQGPVHVRGLPPVLQNIKTKLYEKPKTSKLKSKTGITKKRFERKKMMCLNSRSIFANSPNKIQIF